MNKKGDLTFTELIGFILGGIVILTLIFFVIGISDILKNNPEQAAFDNFDALTKTINDVVSAEPGKPLSAFPDQKIEVVPAQRNAVQAIVPIYIQDGFAILGFDKDTIRETCGISSNLQIPEACTSKPCICLGKQGTLLSRDALKEIASYQSCVPLKNVNQIRTISQGNTANFNFGASRETGGSDLVLLSRCNRFGGAFNVRNLKILRMPSSVEGKYDILIDSLSK